jgi:hypothetical protein
MEVEMPSLHKRAQREPQVKVNLTLNFVPFGDVRNQESPGPANRPAELNPEAELASEAAEQGTRLDEFFFPEKTAVSDMVPAPGPLLKIKR